MWQLLPPPARVPDALPLVRRGILHGHLLRTPDDPTGAATEPDLDAAWADAQPIALPGILAGALPSLQPCIAQSRTLFEHLRGGGRFLDAVLDLLEGDPSFRPEGSTVDKSEPREIEKVFVSGLADGKRVRAARDVWAKLSWVAHDEDDLSLRIRFSCGTEQLQDWHRDVAAQLWADRFAEALFPECAAIAQNPDLSAIVHGLLGGPPRVSERILYSLAPGGGVVFHHDADPTQRGVVYGQLHGATAWLALPLHDLVRHILEHATATANPDVPPSAAEIRRRLATEDEALFHLLNADPTFTRRLADAGWLTVIDPGDALLLPSHDLERVAWHALFALGDDPGLAHSYGLFTP